MRRNAWDDLVAIGPVAVPPLMEAWHQSPDEYQTKLGAVVVLNRMLRNHPEMASQISANLKDDDIRLLAETKSDDDKTIRMQVREFL